MAALFGLGVIPSGMDGRSARSLTSMALIAALVMLEKVGLWPLGARLATAAVLGVLAAGIVAAPHDVPGLVVPGPGAMQAMAAMG